MKVGDKVRVKKPNLLSTGWNGTVIKVEGVKITVEFKNRQRPYYYGKGSLALIPNDKKAEPVKKPKKFITVNTPTLPVNTAVYVAYKNDRGVVKAYYDKIVDFDEDNIKFTINGSVKYTDILMMFDSGKEITFSKPEVDEYPFWVFKEDTIKKRISSVQLNDKSEVSFKTKEGYILPLKWVTDATTTLCIEQKQVEVEPPIEPANLDDAINKHINSKFKLDRRKNARMSFGVVGICKKTGKPLMVHRDGAACHYAMKTFKGDLPPKNYDYKYGVQFITNNYYDGDAERKKLIEEYTMWVMNDSPWSRYVITKDWEDALANGIKVKLDVPDNAMMCTFYALRYPTEYMAKVTSWKRLVDAGMNPQAAFFCAETNMLHGDSQQHHQLLYTYKMSLDDLKNFINKGVGGIVNRNYTETYSYSRVSMHHASSEVNVAESAVKALRKMDIFGDEKAAAGAFGGGGAKVADTEKVIKILNGYVE